MHRRLMSASRVPARVLSPPPSWRKIAKYLNLYVDFSVEVLWCFACRTTFEHAMPHVRTCIFEHGVFEHDVYEHAYSSMP